MLINIFLASQFFSPSSDSEQISRHIFLVLGPKNFLLHPVLLFSFFDWLPSSISASHSSDHLLPLSPFITESLKCTVFFLTPQVSACLNLQLSPCSQLPRAQQGTLLSAAYFLYVLSCFHYTVIYLCIFGIANASCQILNALFSDFFNYFTYQMFYSTVCTDIHYVIPLKSQ